LSPRAAPQKARLSSSQVVDPKRRSCPIVPDRRPGKLVSFVCLASRIWTLDFGLWTLNLLACARVQKQFFIAAVGVALLVSSCSQSTPTSVSGTVETDEVHVGSRYGGRVQKLFAQEGDSLTNGQIIAELDATELPARRDRMAAQLAELEAGPRKEEIAAAKADWEAQLADLELAHTNAIRSAELFSHNTISATERDQTLSRANLLEKTTAAAKSRYDLLLAGTRPEEIAQARAQLAELDTQLSEMKIKAPSESTLEVLGVKVGDVVAPNQPVATLILPHIWVRVYVPETWLTHIEVGDTAKVRADGHPGHNFSGVVEQIAREAEFTPRNVQTVEERVKQVFGIKVRLDDENGEFRAGMSVDVSFPNVAK
jgi:HlyD family secretion protein